MLSADNSVRFLQNLREVAQNCRRTKCTEHASNKIRASRRLEPYILLILRTLTVYCPWNLEAQQRYFSYRTIIVGIVSQNSFVFAFMGYRTLITRYVAKLGITQVCLCETKYQSGVSHRLRTSLKKYRAIWGIAAMVSQYRAIWGH